MLKRHCKWGGQVCWQTLLQAFHRDSGMTVCLSCFPWFAGVADGPTPSHVSWHTLRSQAPESLAWASALFGLGFVGASSWPGSFLTVG